MKKTNKKITTLITASTLLGGGIIGAVAQACSNSPAPSENDVQILRQSMGELANYNSANRETISGNAQIVLGVFENFVNAQQINSITFTGEIDVIVNIDGTYRIIIGSDAVANANNDVVIIFPSTTATTDNIPSVWSNSGNLALNVTGFSIVNNVVVAPTAINATTFDNTNGGNTFSQNQIATSTLNVVFSLNGNTSQPNESQPQLVWDAIYTQLESRLGVPLFERGIQYFVAGTTTRVSNINIARQLIVNKQGTTVSLNSGALNVMYFPENITTPISFTTVNNVNINLTLSNTIITAATVSTISAPFFTPVAFLTAVVASSAGLPELPNDENRMSVIFAWIFVIQAIDASAQFASTNSFSTGDFTVTENTSDPTTYDVTFSAAQALIIGTTGGTLNTWTSTADLILNVTFDTQNTIGLATVSNGSFTGS